MQEQELMKISHICKTKPNKTRLVQVTFYTIQSENKSGVFYEFENVFIPMHLTHSAQGTCEHVPHNATVQARDV